MNSGGSQRVSAAVEAEFLLGVFAMILDGLGADMHGVIRLLSKVKLKVAVNEDYVQPTIKAILKAARSEPGRIGDGKIFVLPLEECYRIRTGEKGNTAIGP